MISSTRLDLEERGMRGSHQSHVEVEEPLWKYIFCQTHCVQTGCVQTDCVQTDCVQPDCVQTDCEQTGRLPEGATQTDRDERVWFSS